MRVSIIPEEHKILIVDDIEANVLLLRARLKGEGYQLYSANSGFAALDIIEEVHPDLIILDVMMPGIDGFDTAKIIRSREDELKSVPIIFLTALTSPEDIVKGFRSGGNDYVTKPFNKDELRERVNLQLSLISANRVIKRQNAELKEVINGRDRLYSVIAHDLRSPMGSMKMALEMLQISLPKETIDPFYYDMLSSASRTAEELFDLLDNLLKWTKTQAGRLNVVIQDFNITETIDAHINVFKMNTEIKNIKLTFNHDQDELIVSADIDMIKTILRNLLSNAVKFSNQGGEIIISLEKKEDNVCVSIQDFGVGIKEENKPKIFCGDDHISTYGTANEEGSGLGLFLCQSFIDRNNGSIGFESKEGDGSIFFFTLPLKQA